MMIIAGHNIVFVFVFVFVFILPYCKKYYKRKLKKQNVNKSFHSLPLSKSR